MRPRFRVPMAVIAGGLLGLIALLATLQYTWLGQISGAERERMKATLSARATAYAQDVDRELTRAYLLFQLDALQPDQGTAARIGARFDRWQATARFPRMVKDIYLVPPPDASNQPLRLQRYNAATRFVEPATWPDAAAPIREQLSVTAPTVPTTPGATILMRAMVPPVWASVPALVIPAPMLMVSHVSAAAALHGTPTRVTPTVRYTIVLLDAEYMKKEMLPALAQQHFQGTGDGFDYQLAVVPIAAGKDPLYRSVAAFTPGPETKADANVELFQVRVKDFEPLAAEVSRFATLSTLPHITDQRTHTIYRETLSGGRGGATATVNGAPLSIIVQGTSVAGDPRERRGAPGVPAPRPGSGRPEHESKGASERAGGSGAASPRSGFGEVSPEPTQARPGAEADGAKPPGQEMLQQRIDKMITGASAATFSTRVNLATPAQWRLVVKHPSGSLEHAVNAARRRNLAISTSILGILGLSVGFLVLSTRRAQDLARQQLEFVATVSHELRTPLAVIRSAADNLADGVVDDEARVRQYGQLVRREGLRLTDLVEQILEFAGLQSGQRTIVVRPVEIGTLLRDVAATAEATAAADVTIELSIPDNLPAVAGDESALRRVFQNLIGNAIKYSTDARTSGASAPRERSGESGVPASERVGGAGGAKPPGKKCIAISASAGVGTLDISVTDRGIGIAAADQARIFDPFYRAPNVVAAQIQGAGLGLSLVKRIVEAHAGRITLKSAPGAGSTFTVTLPVLKGDVVEGPQSVSDAAPQPS